MPFKPLYYTSSALTRWLSCIPCVTTQSHRHELFSSKIGETCIFIFPLAPFIIAPRVAFLI